MNDIYPKYRIVSHPDGYAIQVKTVAKGGFVIHKRVGGCFGMALLVDDVYGSLKRAERRFEALVKESERLHARATYRPEVVFPGPDGAP